MTEDPKVYVRHILDSAKYIEGFIEGYTKTTFAADRKTYDAVVRELAVIGEACAHLSEDFRQQFAGIPWRKIKAMRNKLTHEYWDIDSNIIWEAACVKVPELVVQLKAWMGETNGEL